MSDNIKYNRPVRILVAEDDEDDRSFLSDAFSKIEIVNSIEFVENGQELLSYLKTASKLPDLIFLDLNMPLVDGMEALSAIKENIDFKKLPIIILTTSKNQEHIYKTYMKGISAYIVKPFTYEALNEMIKKTTDFYFKVATLPTEQEQN